MRAPAVLLLATLCGCLANPWDRYACDSAADCKGGELCLARRCTPPAGSSSGNGSSAPASSTTPSWSGATSSGGGSGSSSAGGPSSSSFSPSSSAPTASSGLDCSGGQCVVAMTAGAVHMCARTRDGKLYCWGNNAFHQVSPSASAQVVMQPTEVPGVEGGTLQIAAGQHTCSTDGDGGLRCWGNNSVGQCGLSPDAGTAVVMPLLQPLANVTSVAAGGLATCAVVQGGNVYCWGTGVLVPGYQGPTPQFLNNDAQYRDLVTGSTHACLRLQDKTVRCWGANGNHQVDESGFGQVNPPPVDVPSARNSDAISAGSGNFTCALKGAQVFCWGANDRGQLGQQDAGPTSIALQIAGVSARQVSSGPSHSCVVTTAGRVACWGDNSQRQCGQAAPAVLYAPTEVPNVNNAVEVVAGSAHSCARISDGGVYCWGDNQNGALGRPGTGADAVPQAVDWPAH